MSVSGLIHSFLARLVPPIITYTVMLPIAVIVYFGTKVDEDPSSGLSLVGHVFGVAAILCIITGGAAMVGAYAIFFVNRSSPWSKRLMKYGADLIIFGFAAIGVVGVLDQLGIVDLA